MKKKILFLGVFAFLFVGSLISQAQQDSLTITTYFPAPYGVFQNLTMRMFAVGNTTAMPGAEGSLAWGSDAQSRGLLSSNDGSIDLGSNVAAQPWLRLSHGVGNKNLTLRTPTILTIYLNTLMPGRMQIINAGGNLGALYVGTFWYMDGWGVFKNVNQSGLIVT